MEKEALGLHLLQMSYLLEERPYIFQLMDYIVANQLGLVLAELQALMRASLVIKQVGQMSLAQKEVSRM